MTISVVTMTIIRLSAMLSSIISATLGPAFPPFIIGPSDHPHAYLLNTPEHCHYISFVLIVPGQCQCLPSALTRPFLGSPGTEVGAHCCTPPRPVRTLSCLQTQNKTRLYTESQRVPKMYSVQWYL